MDEINKILNKMFYDMAPDKMKFPQGFKWKYYRVAKVPRRREWWCCYSSTRNANKKFISWVYEWVGKKTKTRFIKEHRTKKKAIGRAQKFYNRRKEEIVNDVKKPEEAAIK